MLVNRDESEAHGVTVEFDYAEGKRTKAFKGPVTAVTFGAEQYRSKDDGPDSHPDPDGPRVATTVMATGATVFTLPKPR